MKFLWLTLVVGTLCFAAQPEQKYPTYGETVAGSIKVLIAGHGIERAGYYILPEPSLAAVIKANKPKLSPHVRDVVVTREREGEKFRFRIAVADLRKDGEFMLKNGDVAWIVTPLF